MRRSCLVESKSTGAFLIHKTKKGIVMMEERIISRPRPRRRRRSLPYHLPDLLTAVFFTVALPLAGAAWLMRGTEPALPEPPGIFAEAAAPEQDGASILPEDTAEGTPWDLRLFQY